MTEQMKILQTVLTSAQHYSLSRLSQLSLSRFNMLAISLFMSMAVFAVLALAPAPAHAAGGCQSGATAPCAEDPAIKACNVCHSFQIQAGNRNGTDRFITLMNGTGRHILDPKLADWTATVNSMISKGAQADPTITPGYLNMNYCATCTGVIVSGPTVVNIKDTSATITWSTSLSDWGDGPADSVVFYGTSPTALTSQASDPTMTGAHAVTLTGLTASKKYYFQYQSTGADGKTVKYNFDTPSFRTAAPQGGGGGGTTTTTFAYVVNENSGTVSVVNTDKGTLQTTIFLNETIRGIAASPDGKSVYVTGYYQTPGGWLQADLFVIDTASNTIRTTVQNIDPYHPNSSRLAMSPDGQYLYSLEWPEYLMVFSTATLSVVKNTDIAQCSFMGCGDFGLSPDGNTLYVVAASYDSSTFKIDAASARNPSVSTTITPVTLPGNPGASSVAIGTDGTAWIPGFYSYLGFTKVTSAGAASAVAGMFGTGNGGVAVAPDGSAVIAPQYVNSYSQISSLDTTTMKVTSSASGIFPSYWLQNVAFNADGSKIFADGYCYADVVCPDLFFVVDPGTLTVLSSVPVGSRPYKMALVTVTTTTGPPAPPPTLIYSANGNINNVSVIDPATNSVTATIPVTSSALAVAASPDGKMAYAVNGDSTVSVITRSSQTVTATITLPDPVTGGAAAVVGPGNNVLYVANYNATKIYVINTATNAITATIPVGVAGPYGASVGPADLAISSDGTTLYASVDGSGQDGYVAVIATSSNTVASKITLPVLNTSGYHSGGQHIAANPLGGFAYVAASGTLQFIDTVANSVITSAKPANDPTGSGTCYSYNTVAVAPDGTAVALSCWGVITVFDTGTLQPTKNSGSNILNAISSMAFNADGSFLYAGYANAVEVDAIDTSALGAPTAVIAIPYYSNKLASSPAVVSVAGGAPSLTAPDLTVTALSANATVNLSVSPNVTITDTVSNIGGFKAGSFAVNYYFSPTNTFNSATAVLIGSRTVAGPLNPAGTNTATTSFTVAPSALPAGAYYVIAVADGNQQIAEGNEDNNARPTTATSQVIVADLIMTSVTSPAIGTTILPGASISVTDTVKNQGTGAAAIFSIGYYLYPVGGGPANFLGSRTVSTLAAGATSTSTKSFTVPAAAYGGPFYIQAVADYTNQSPESNESNNTLTNTTGIITVSPPDLVITAVSFTPTSLTRPGTVSITYTVKNQGSSKAAAFRVGFYLSTDNVITTSDKLIGSSNTVTNGLAAGATLTATLTFTVQTTVAAGTYYVGAYADYLLQAPEGNETNNGLAASGTLVVH